LPSAPPPKFSPDQSPLKNETAPPKIIFKINTTHVGQKRNRPETDSPSIHPETDKNNESEESPGCDFEHDNYEVGDCLLSDQNSEKQKGLSDD
jgi:hypothetical protein